MQDFFSEQTYYQFPSLESAIYALLLSFLLSTVIAFVYRYTYRGDSYSKDLFQAIVLIAIIAAMIMMAIGDSLARGLGILGALAIIRFRFRFNNPKNIVYIFAALAIGISSGVYGFAIALSGTVVFSLIAFGLYFSPYGKPDTFNMSLSFILSDPEQLQKVERMLNNYCDAVRLQNISETNNTEKFEYQIQLRKEADRTALFRAISAMDAVSNVRLNNRGSVDRI